MSAITKGRRFGVFALAQGFFSGLHDGKTQWFEPGALMRAVTEGLAGRPAATAPPVFLARFQFQGDRLQGDNFWFIHGGQAPLLD